MKQFMKVVWKPLLRLIFLWLMMWLSLKGLSSYEPPFALFFVTVFAFGVVCSKMLMPWVTQERDEKDRELMREARTRMDAIQKQIDYNTQLELQRLFAEAARLNSIVKGEGRKEQ